jgi:hypothetical protein
MNQRIKMIVLLVVGLFTVPSWCIAQNRDGNKLLESCEAAIATQQLADASQMFGAGFCLGLMQGIGRMNDFYEAASLNGTALFCRPPGANNGQSARIVLKYLRDHPEELHKEDFVLTVAALRDAFPCKNKK